MKPVLIIENSKNAMKVNESNTTKDRKYVLEGVFTEFDVINRNERIYSANEFVPHVDEMMKKKEWGVIYGEFDHPDVFDVSMKYISHTVENAWYNKEKNTIDGEIRLLNTHYGRDAQSLVDDGCPLFVSSRAAGITEGNGNVKLKQLFTYDIVADPGFASAKMSVKTLNESLGFNQKTVGIIEADKDKLSLLSEAYNQASQVSDYHLFDLSDDSKTEELFNMNKNDLVTKKQLSDYSKHLAEQLQTNNKAITDMIKESKGEAKTKEGHSLEDLMSYNESLQENMTKMVKYMDYLAESLSNSIKSTTVLEKKTADIVEYTDYLAENLDTNIEKQEMLSETLNKSIEYSDYLAENMDKTIGFTNYLAENIDQMIDYSQYIAENLSNSIKFSNYLAENLDRAIDYSDYIAENLDANIGYASYIAENLDVNIGYTEYIVENLESNIDYSDYLAECIDKTMDFSNSIVESINNGEETPVNEKLQTAQEFLIKESLETTTETEVETEELTVTEEEETTTEEEKSKEKEKTTEEEEEETTEVTTNVVAEEEETTEEETEKKGSEEEETITTTEEEETISTEVNDNFKEFINDDTSNESLNSKIDNLIAEAKKREASKGDRPNFYEFLNPTDIQAFENLSNEQQEEIRVAVNESTGYYGRHDVLNIMKQVLEVDKVTPEELLIQSMPDDVKQIWESMNNDYKKSVISQSKLYDTSTSQLCEHFWSTRKLEKYVLNEGKTLIASENPFDKMNKLSDNQIDDFTSRFKNL